MNEILKNEKVNISSIIYRVRGEQVMLDTDLALLYHVETKRINEAVNRNKEKFPERFSWVLDAFEEDILWSQNATANLSSKSRVQHRVFTEQGVAMLATILKSKTATEVSISIMDTFVAMRKYISRDLYYSNYVLDNHENRLIKLEETFDKMQEKQKVSTIFYNGQIFDAYSLLMDILNKAMGEIIIIDNYAGKELLDILKNINKKIIIISKNIDEMLIKKYEEQYTNVEFKQLDIFHDRFIIIDRKKLYNCGLSFKDLGKKCFAINGMESKDILDILISKIFNG